MIERIALPGSRHSVSRFEFDSKNREYGYTHETGHWLPMRLPSGESILEHVADLPFEAVFEAQPAPEEEEQYSIDIVLSDLTPSASIELGVEGAIASSLDADLFRISDDISGRSRAGSVDEMCWSGRSSWGV